MLRAGQWLQCLYIIWKYKRQSATARKICLAIATRCDSPIAYVYSMKLSCKTSDGYKILSIDSHYFQSFI